MDGLPIQFQMVASEKRTTCPDADERRIEALKMQDLECMTSLQLRAVLAELERLEQKKALYEMETDGQWQGPDNALPAAEMPSFKRLSAR